ncbi:MAG: MaoC family dehydratase N-terminal domain-containing protein [Rhodococcus sp. (in: high G+C Gram-positive bacteria)]
MVVVRTEALRVAPAAAYRGTFAPTVEEPKSTGELQPGWEGLYFPFDAALADLRPDGSPTDDGVLPVIDLPRRMYAGEDTVFHRPLAYDDVVEQRVQVGAIVEKEGRGGRLVFADVERKYYVDGELAISTVWHDVFLEAAKPGAVTKPPAPAPDVEWDWSESSTLDARQLFRFSALTFNTHLVHYDRDWARNVEGLQDLLVHGPLVRILLLDLAVRSQPGVRVRSFSLQMQAPVFVDTEVQLVGRVTDAGSEVFVLDAENRVLARGVAATSG